MEIATACEAWLARQGQGPEDAAEVAYDGGDAPLPGGLCGGVLLDAMGFVKVQQRVQEVYVLLGADHALEDEVVLGVGEGWAHVAA